MKHLKDYEKELNKCSKCGLCQAACPLFQISKNDCTVSKGKFVMLHGVTKGDLKLSKNINKYIDLCLRCGKCNLYCPSGIDACEILNVAKHDFVKNKSIFKITKFLESKLVFNSIINILSRLTSPFRPERYKVQDSSIKVLYFKGCVNKIFPNTDKYINKIFSSSDVEIIEPNFDCCGLPFISHGNLERFEQAARHNIKRLNCEYDYIISDCASCCDTILNYPKYISDFEINSGKVINWGNLIAYKDIKFEFSKPIKVTFHKPCHLPSDIFLKKIFSNCKNVEYVEMENRDNCCGFAGTFALKNNKISTILMKNKAESIINTNADIVLTSCPACIIGLRCGLKLKGKQNIKVMSLLEFLASADGIKY